MERSLFGRSRASAPALALVVGLALTGCAPTESNRASQSPTPSTSESGDSAQLPTQKPAPPPSTAEGALESAIQTVAAYEEVAFDIASFTVDYSALDNFGGWIGAADWEGILSRNDSDVLVGKPGTWIFDDAMSSASTLVVGADSYEFAAVRLAGCLNVNWAIEYVDPQLQTEWTADDVLPRWVTVEYSPERKIWLVTGGGDLSGRPEAPDCESGDS